MIRIARAALGVALTLLAAPAAAQEPPNPAEPAAAAPAPGIAPPGAPAAAAAAPAAEAPRPAPAPKPEPKPEPKSAATSRQPTFYGVLNVQYSRTDAPAPARDTSTLELRRARIGARGELLPQVGYNVIFDGADTSLKDAYGVLKALPLAPGVEVRFGQWKTPFGYEQPESDTKLLWVNSSYVVANLARGPDARDLGVGLQGRWAVGAVGAELAASVVNGAGPNVRDNLDEKNFWGRAGPVVKVGALTARLGVSYGHGRQVASLGANNRFDRAGAVNAGAASGTSDDTYFWFQTYGADVQLDTPWFFAVAEVAQSERDQQAFTSPTAFTETELLARGWYAGAYGKTPWGVGPVVRAERFDRNRHAAGNENERYTVGAYADLAPLNARLIFNYEWDESKRAVRTGDRAIVFGQVLF